MSDITPASVQVVHCDIPENMTLDEWRKQRCTPKVTLRQKLKALFDRK